MMGKLELWSQERMDTRVVPFDRNLYKRTIAECVREVIYKDKEAIVDRIVVQASRECRTKAIKKLLEESK